ncbi:hypothetical protein DYB35_013716, partial [Aphanomyces astaci]
AFVPGAVVVVAGVLLVVLCVAVVVLGATVVVTGEAMLVAGPEWKGSSDSTLTRLSEVDAKDLRKPGTESATMGVCLSYLVQV